MTLYNMDNIPGEMFGLVTGCGDVVTMQNHFKYLLFQDKVINSV